MYSHGNFCIRGVGPSLKIIYILASISWSLWLTRIFNARIVTQPEMVVHRLNFMQKWSILLKEKDRSWARRMMEEVPRRLTQPGIQ